jgi:hypothetical protein
MQSRFIVLTAGALLCATLGLAGCEKGPAEKVGEKIDHGVDTLKNGGKEPLKDRAEDAANDAREGIKDAADDLKKDH